MPQIVADTNQGRAGEQQPIGVGETHQQVGNADPGERDRHQHALASDAVDDEAAGHVGDRAGHELHGQDRADLGIAQAELVADQRQQQEERGWVPMGERVPDADQPDIDERSPRRNLGGRCGHESRRRVCAGGRTAERSPLPRAAVAFNPWACAGDAISMDGVARRARVGFTARTLRRRGHRLA
jgi:hypothetical protein